MPHRGYVKVWRKVLESGWLTNPNVWTFWSWCLLKASHKEIDVVVGFQQVHLMPGEFVFGRKKASKELKLSEQEIRTCIDFLKKAKNLTIKSTNKFSIISIVNWSIYQGSEDDEQPSNQPTSNQQVTTNKNVKNEKNRYTAEFESFWEAYPRKIAKWKAWIIWKRLNGKLPPIDILLSAINIQAQSEQWSKNGGKYIPYPVTWLNAERWNDELEVTKKPNIDWENMP